jgi:pimeloyl-ACP methyl ester carboxylesterase
MIRYFLKRAAAMLITSIVIPYTAAAACKSSCRPDGKQGSGAIYRICMPEPGCYNGDLLIYAHGYVDAYEPVGIPEDQLTLPDGTSVPGLINSLGYGFATTSYSRNGLAVVEGVRDVRDLVDVYSRDVGAPRRVYLAGPSEGGLVTAKAVEAYPNVFTGGLAACGPIGNFRAQINYIGDFRVLFDYFFPGVIPGKATEVPQEVIDNWDAVYVPKIKAALIANPAAAIELIRVGRVPIWLSAANIEDAVLSVAWYTVFATNDATQQLGGPPFDNIGKWYTGSSNDVRLNLLVKRYAAAPQALATMQSFYETTGLLSIPVVTMHTTGDQVLPYWHEPLYRAKVESTGSAGKHINIPILRYGHCNLKVAEVLFGFALLVLQTTGERIPGLQPN